MVQKVMFQRKDTVGNDPPTLLIMAPIMATIPWLRMMPNFRVPVSKLENSHEEINLLVVLSTSVLSMMMTMGEKAE